MKDVNLLNLGNRIRRVRNLNRLSQTATSKGIVSISHYSNIENGRYAASEDTLSLLASRLSVPSSYFINTHVVSNQMNEMLRMYEEMIERGDTEETQNFMESNRERFEFIASLQDEFYFRVLYFLDLINSKRVLEAAEFYKHHISCFDVIPSSLTNQMQQKYFFATGIYYFATNNYMESINYFQKSLQINNNTQLSAKISYNIALSYFNLYRYDEAISYVKEASNFYLNLHNWEKTGDCYNLLSILLREKRLLAEAEDFIHRGFDISNEGSFELRAKLFHNLALIKLDQGLYEEAIENINKSILLKQNIGSVNLFISYKVKLDILLTNKDILSLKKELKHAQKYIKTKIDKANFQFIEANMHYLMEDYDSYENLIEQSIEAYLVQESWINLDPATDHYSSYLEERSKYKKALKIQKLCTLSVKKLLGEKNYEKN